MRGVEDLAAERVAALDAPLSSYDGRLPIDPSITRFITVLGRTVSTDPAGPDLRPTSAAVVDAIISQSVLLQGLKQGFPELAAGPIPRDRQFWVARGETASRPAKRPQPEERGLLMPTTADSPVTKPARFGLFTSTGFAGTFGMWHAYLQLHRGSTLFPEPWVAWRLRPAPDARILEISTASDWVAFVGEHARLVDGVVFPDWTSVAHANDGVHMSASAIAAIQGFSLELGSHRVAPSYWDVESTVWLRWVFSESARASSP